MVYGKKQLFLAFLCTAVLGSGLHFLYSLFPNPATALFSPVNESLWEHLKILFWPYLGAAFLLCWNRPTGVRPWLMTLLLLCGLMLAVGFWYHIRLGGHALWADIVLYLALLGLGFWLPTRLSGPFRGWSWAAPAVAAALLGVLLVLFTFFPPHGILFVDLSGI